MRPTRRSSSTFLGASISTLPALRRLTGGEPLLLIFLVLWAAGLLVLPLGHLAAVAFSQDGTFSLEPMRAILESRSAWRAVVNSLESSLVSALGALLLGSVLALTVGLCDLRFKGVLVFLILLPMMIPPHVTAISWIQALGPASPVLQWLGVAPEAGSTHPLYSAAGVMFLLSIQHAPLVFLIVRAALRAMPRELVEAGRISGARPLRVFLRVVLPLIAPSLVAAAALAFVSALGNFGIPALLGIPARYTTLPVLIWQRLASFGPSVLTDMAAVAVLIAAIAVAAVLIQQWLQRRAGAVLTGPPRAALDVALGRYRLPVEALVWSVIAATLFLPLVSLLATALVPTYGVPLSWETVTFANFDEVLFRQGVTARAFANSTMAAGGAAVVLALMAALAGHLSARSKRPAIRHTAGGIAALGDITYAVPGLVISVAFILTFLKPIPGIGLSLYSTLTLIFLAYLCAFFSVAAKPVAAAFTQLDPALDDAARCAGAGFWRRLWRISLPLVAPALLSAAMLVFLISYNEITISALLWSSGNETIGTVIFNYEDGGYTVLAAAMSAVTVVATVLLMAMLDRLGRYLPAGAVPWR